MIFVFDTDDFSRLDVAGKKEYIKEIRNMILCFCLLGRSDEDSASYAGLIEFSVNLYRSLVDFILNGHDFKDSFRST